MPYFAPGDRVRVRGGSGFPDGITGTIRMPQPFQYEDRGPGGWDGCQLTQHTERGTAVSYFVEFDEPHDDGSGDGPYTASEILVQYLDAISE